MAEFNAARAEAIRSRCEAATPGPWKWTPQEEEVERDGTVEKVTGAQIESIFTFDTGEGYYGVENNNAEFIAHARTDLPDALAEIERLTAQVETLQGERDAHGVAEVLEPGGYELIKRDEAGALRQRADSAEAQVTALRALVARYLDNHCANADVEGASTLCECQLCQDARQQIAGIQ